MPRINPDRLLADLRALRAIGAQGHGVVRPAFSAADMEARHWLRQRYEQAGLDATIDGVGNVLGRSRHPGKALLTGSHSDTQPTGGWLDGALGVIYALEVVRAFAESESTRRLPVDAVSFQDEESRFVGCLGSRSLIGALTPAVEQGATDSHGVTLVDALREAGLAECAAAATRARALRRFHRGAHRTGPASGGRRSTDRRGDGHRRLARHPLRLSRPAEPCRHDDDVAPARCLHGAVRTGAPDQPGVSESGSRAQRLDHGALARRAERGVDRSGLRRARPAVPGPVGRAPRCL